MNYAKFIDHTLLKPESTRQQIDQIIDEAKEYNFKSICVNPTHVKYATERLNDSGVLVCTVIGFPLGATTTATKIFETEDAIKMAQLNLIWLSISAHLKMEDLKMFKKTLRA